MNGKLNWQDLMGIAGYTLSICVIVCGVTMYFVKDEPGEAKDDQIASYMAKSDLLQSRLDALQEENARLETKVRLCLEQDQTSSSHSEISALLLKANREPAPKGRQEPTPYGISFSISKHTAYIEPRTGLRVGLKNVFADRSCEIVLTLPKQSSQTVTAFAGGQWDLDLSSELYSLTITKVDFYGDSVTFDLRQVSPDSGTGP